MERGGIWFSKENVKVESRKFCSLQGKKKTLKKKFFFCQERISPQRREILLLYRNGESRSSGRRQDSAEIGQLPQGRLLLSKIYNEEEELS